MPEIYCDEAGNSGQNLLDAQQPVFVLASTDMNREEATELLRHVRSRQGAEPKFKTLKKTSDGVHKIRQFFADPRLDGKRIVMNIFHKRFMIVTKMVDLIAETLFHQIGEDLYKRGANIAMANMLYYCMPPFCGRKATDRFLQSFVDLLRLRTERSVKNYYAAGRAMVKGSKNKEFRRDLYVFTEPRLFAEWYPGIGTDPLDPAIPALFQHIAIWGMRKTDRFRVVHDRSKPILASQPQFQRMMAIGDEPATMVGYDRRQYKFPLQAQSLEQADSHEFPQLQVADICAGGLAHVLKCREMGAYDQLAEVIEGRCREFVVDAVAPTTSVSPEELGTDSEVGTNPVDPVVELLKRRRSNSRT